MKILFRWLLMGVLVFGFVGCSNEGSTTLLVVYTPQEIAIDKIKEFSQSEENATTYTVQDYIDAGVVVEANKTISGLTSEDVDIADETQAIMDNLIPKVEDTITTPINHTPIFISDATVSVDENQDSAITLMATDADNDSLLFSISGTDAGSFTLLNGVVTFNANPNYEDKISYSFIATVSDGVNETNQSVTININNLNDNAPIFISDATVSVDENQDSAITLMATDADNDSLLFSISGTDAGSFTLLNGVVTFNANPNYEDKISYSFIATVSDGVNETNQSVTININNLNDNAPIFISDATVSVDENQDSAITLMATDADNDSLLFSISGTDAGSFTLLNGVVTFNANPNYEDKISYSFIATVSDGVNETNQSVTINITDIAETVPILGSDVNLSLAENTNISTDIASIVISDEGDTDIYSFEINGTGSSKFAIATDGTITLEEALDYETKTFYEFNITAINEAGRSNTIILEVNVTDIEDIITLAVYDNNHTTTPTDDILRVYFNKAIDTNTRSDVSANNYSINGVGDLDSVSGTYSVVHKEDRISSSIVTALEPYESSISILSNTITDSNGISYDISYITLISAYAMKQTGQILSYEENGTEHTDVTQKDDGYYQSGVRQQYSRDDSKEVILDHITGLMWADDENVSTVTKRWVTIGNFSARNYFDTSGDTATTYCSDLTLGGYSNWRLPSIDELVYITDKGKVNPSIDKSVFQNTAPKRYWTSTNYFNYGAWSVYFYYGYDSYDNKFASNYVRCVRARE